MIARHALQTKEAATAAVAHSKLRHVFVLHFGLK